MPRVEKTAKGYNKMTDGVFLRGRIWWICYRHAGETVWESSGSTERRDAVALRESKRTQSNQGTLVPNARRLTWDDLKRIYEEAAVEKGNRSLPKWRHLDDAFAGARALEVAARCHTYFAARLADGYAIATVNQDKAALRRMFRLARERGLISADQVPVIKTPDPKNARKGFVTPKQFMAVAQELPEHMQGVWGFAYLTGWRTRSEILPLQWSNVDWRAGVVRIEDSKNGEPREFPFYQPLATLLQAQKAETHGPYIFHTASGERIAYERWNDARRRACRRAKVDAIAHDLRRTAVRNLERAGVSRSVAMSLTGHKTEAVYRRYAIVDSMAQQEGVAKLATALALTP